MRVLKKGGTEKIKSNTNIGKIYNQVTFGMAA